MVAIATHGSAIIKVVMLGKGSGVRIIGNSELMKFYTFQLQYTLCHTNRGMHIGYWWEIQKERDHKEDKR
jgi:hypothetical protein